MPSNRKNGRDLPQDLSTLDDLIKLYYSKLLKDIEKNAKLGDFLKMIELRRKLAPDDSEQKRFWKMLAKIRREALSGKETGKPVSARKKGTKKKSGGVP